MKANFENIKPVRSKDNFLVFGAPAIEDDEIQEVVASMKSGWLGTGPKVARFEQDFATYKGIQYAVAVNSCTAALHLGMIAAGLKNGDEVITTPMTFCATVNAIIHAGATPVLADVDPATMNIDPNEVEKKITSKTRAILPVHFAGRSCNMDALCDIAKKHHLKIIEDCAHAFLSEYKGRPVGSFGDISIFSFRKTLPIPDGAALVINNDRIIYKNSHRKPNIFSTYYVIAEYLKNQTAMRENLLKQTLLKFVRNSAYWSFFAARLILRILHKIFKDKGLYLVYPSGNVYRKEIADWGVSPLSKRIISSSDFQQIKKIRRRNFKFLLKYFGDDTRFCLPIKELPVGVCPLFFPIFSEKRDVLYSLLKRRGIAGHDWWGDFHPDVPWREFPAARFMKAHVFGFPIHQSLTLLHLQKIIEEFTYILNCVINRLCRKRSKIKNQKL